MSNIDSRKMSWKARSKAGVVAAGAAESVAAGVRILENGGNAADAAVATILALNVTDHGPCSIGGEVPLIIYDAKKQETKVLCGQGSAPLSQSAMDWYMQHGIPHKNDIKIAPVPSVIDLCTTTLQLYGTKTFEEVVLPALTLLDNGKDPWQCKLAITLRKLIESERFASGNREKKIQSVSDRFYGRKEGPVDIADDLVADYIENGGFLRREDLAAHHTRIEDPVSITYRGYTVYKCGPWTQGPYLCQALRLLEKFDLKSMGFLSAYYIHVVMEAVKLAMADRDEYYGDPEFVKVPMKVLMSDEYTKLRQPLIDMQKASLEVRPGDPNKMVALKGPGQFRPGVGGTTTCVVADRFGNVVSATPSANVENFDGGRTGVTYSNRLCSLNTMPGHPNCIQAGKRPRITLTPTMVMKNKIPILAISIAGADLQDHFALHLLLCVVEFVILPDAAVTAPRFATKHHQDSFNPTKDREKSFLKAGSLMLNNTVSENVQKELTRRGHEVEATDNLIARAVVLYVDPQNGEIHAAGDPAGGRHARGLVDSE